MKNDELRERLRKMRVLLRNLAAVENKTPEIIKTMAAITNQARTLEVLVNANEQIESLERQEAAEREQAIETIAQYADLFQRLQALQMGVKFWWYDQAQIDKLIEQPRQ